MNAQTDDKAKVIERLKANKAAHKDKVATAQENYQRLVTEELAKRLEQAKEGKSVDPGFLAAFPVPQDYTKEYDRVIDQLEFSDDKTIEIDASEFNQWMRDEWRWQEIFAASNSRYL